MFVVVVDHGHYSESYGPFATAARASGWGFTQYGVNTGYVRPRWHVTPVNSPRKGLTR